jgi:hypothetical protein
VLWCMDIVDTKYRKLKYDSHRAPSTDLVAYKRYMAITGVHPLMMKREQTDYLDTFSNDACLFFLAFAFVDGDNGVANGVARKLLSYVGDVVGEAEWREERKKELEMKLASLEKERKAPSNLFSFPASRDHSGKSYWRSI